MQFHQSCGRLISIVVEIEDLCIGDTGGFVEKHIDAYAAPIVPFYDGRAYVLAVKVVKNGLTASP